MASRSALALKSGAIVAATVILFNRELTLLFSKAILEVTASYVLAVPFFLVFLIYWKRKMLRAVVVEEEQVRNFRYGSLLSGIVLAFAAILLHWYGAYTSAGHEFEMFALPLFVTSLCLVLFNVQTLRQLAFPIVFPILTATALFFASYSKTGLIFQGVSLPGDWAVFLIGTLILFTLRYVIKGRGIAHRPKCLQCSSSRRSDEGFCRQCGRILKPASASLGRGDVVKLFSVFWVVVILVAFQSPFYVLAKGESGVVVVSSAGEYFNKVFPNGLYSVAFLYENVHYAALTNQDFSLNYLFTPKNGSGGQILGSLEIASGRSSLRDWETYVLSPSQGRSRASRIEAEDVVLESTPLTVGRLFVFEYTDIGQIQAVLYWNVTVNFMRDSTIERKYAQVSLIGLPSNMSELVGVKNVLVGLGKAIVEYWQPITSYSVLTLLVIQNGPVLLAAASACLGATMVFYRVEVWRSRRKGQKVLEKLDGADRNVAFAVRETRQPATVENVARTLRERCSENMALEELEGRLAELERLKIVEASVYGLGDEPFRVWRVRV